MSTDENIASHHKTKILVINPNSSKAMTDGMKHVVDACDLSPSTQVSFYTAPSSSSPPSIDDNEGIQQSSRAVLGDTALTSTLHEYDAAVVACYSVDPLVHELAHLAAAAAHTVTGIFEASITTALSLLQPAAQWGIVTTGGFWEDHLTQGVAGFLGQDVIYPSFAGVHTTGLNAGDFHKGVSKEEIERRLKSATKNCLNGGRTRVVIMGCAGMAGLEGIIRAAAAEEYGHEFAYGELHVLDAVRAGVMQVEQMVKLQRLLKQGEK
ncbi:Asp/Glu/hydantoin racemase [Microdochium trichocladiopsis]|uniref:Asp/Glu/hydantoin racemase n=1 Tax=Microdochium trichocladiopsis TaxID=1682393 RepID=A0A9P8XY03_9PEZI|nr:Asp/Glu/hydantoin racemase [Microdochium trichocladiopsis]KAH7025710.1 Asp/Glu/hydantoin racemase [Microdochium trichocladiopsis]